MYQMCVPLGKSFPDSLQVCSHINFTGAGKLMEKLLRKRFFFIFIFSSSDSIRMDFFLFYRTIVFPFLPLFSLNFFCRRLTLDQKKGKE